MSRFLILKLDGPIQAWGDHTFEDFRPSRDFPTRSGLLGLLAACLGIEREDSLSQAKLADSVEFTVRVDPAAIRPERDGKTMPRRAIKLKDYHTVIEARRVNRPPKDGETIQTWREYLYDAHFTVAVGQRGDAAFSLEEIERALAKPVYTPNLGRRSCPLASPLLADAIEAENGIAALAKIPPTGGMIYAETVSEQGYPIILRDIPMHRRKRQFAARKVYVHKERESVDVHQPD
jgi:CRISPR system Cascade subunit CasD